MPQGEEKFSLSEMAAQFDLQRVSLGGPVFDVQKLTWLNGRWLRENLTDEQFAARVQEWALNRDYLMKIVPLVRSRVSSLSDLGPLTSCFFSGELNVSAKDLEDAKLPREIVAKAFSDGLQRLDDLKDWRREAIGSALKELSESFGIKLRDFLRPFYVAITGSATSTPLFDSMEILGRDLCRARLRRALDLLNRSL